MGHEDPVVLLDEVREILPRPVILHARKMAGRVAINDLAPVLVSGLCRASQHELVNEAEVQLHALGDDRAEFVRSFAVVGRPILVLSEET